MEINEIRNSKLKQGLADSVLQMLLNMKLISENELVGFQIQFGYIFTKADGVLEGLMKVICNTKVFYLALQKGSLMLLNINEEQYIQTINYMKEYHTCLNDDNANESDIQKNRRQNNNQFLINNGISINDNLLCMFNDNEVQLKSLDSICKRAVACLITTQIACDINSGNYEKSLNFFLPIYKKYGVDECLNSKEKRIIDGTYTSQDAIDMDWAYEAYWALCWALGLIEDIKNPGLLCDCDKAINLVTSCSTYDEFKNKCKLRNINEILDMHDLYYRYNWAINHKKVDPNTSIGNIDSSNVIERRRGLEWLISNEEDWYNIQMNA